MRQKIRVLVVSMLLALTFSPTSLAKAAGSEGSYGQSAVSQSAPSQTDSVSTTSHADSGSTFDAASAMSAIASFHAKYPATTEDASTGKWYQDKAGMMGVNSKAELTALNEEKLAKIKGHPQVTVMTVVSLPDGETAKSFATEQFNRLGIGAKGWDNGLLLVFFLADRKYALEVGYGLEAVVPDSSQDEVITHDVITLLRAENYDDAISQVLEHLGARIYTHRGEILTPEAVIAKQQQNRQRMLLLTILKWSFISLIVVFFFNHFALRARMRKLLLEPAIMNQFAFYRYMQANKLSWHNHVGLPWRVLYVKRPTLAAIGLRKVIDQHFSEWAAIVQMMQPHPYFYYQWGTGDLPKISPEKLAQSPDLESIAALMAPKIDPLATDFQPFEASFAAWAKKQKELPSVILRVWDEFRSHMDTTARPSDKTLNQLFDLLLNRVLGRTSGQHIDDDLPNWVNTSFGSFNGSSSGGSSGSSGGFGGGFGGGSSGGGGFSGGW